MHMTRALSVLHVVDVNASQPIDYEQDRYLSLALNYSAQLESSTNMDGSEQKESNRVNDLTLVGATAEQKEWIEKLLWYSEPQGREQWQGLTSEERETWFERFEQVKIPEWADRKYKETMRLAKRYLVLYAKKELIISGKGTTVPAKRKTWVVQDDSDSDGEETGQAHRSSSAVNLPADTESLGGSEIHLQRKIKELQEDNELLHRICSESSAREVDFQNQILKLKDEIFDLEEDNAELRENNNKQQKYSREMHNRANDLMEMLETERYQHHEAMVRVHKDHVQTRDSLERAKEENAELRKRVVRMQNRQSNIAQYTTPQLGPRPSSSSRTRTNPSNTRQSILKPHLSMQADVRRHDNFEDTPLSFAQDDEDDFEAEMADIMEASPPKAQWQQFLDKAGALSKPLPKIGRFAPPTRRPAPAQKDSTEGDEQGAGTASHSDKRVRFA